MYSKKRIREPTKKAWKQYIEDLSAQISTRNNCNKAERSQKKPAIENNASRLAFNMMGSKINPIKKIELIDRRKKG